MPRGLPRRSRVMTATTLLPWLLGAQLVGSAAAEQQAARLVEQADRLRRKGEHASALDHYRASYATFPDPNVLCHVGAVLEQMERWAEAAQEYEECLADRAVDGDVRRRSRRHLIRLRTRLARILVEVSPSGAQVSLDGRVAGTAHGPVTVWTDPGPHTVEAEMEGFQRAVEVVDLRSGDRERLSLRLAVNDPDRLAPAPGWACEEVHPAATKAHLFDDLVSPPWAVPATTSLKPRDDLADQLAPPPPWVPR